MCSWCPSPQLTEQPNAYSPGCGAWNSSVVVCPGCMCMLKFISGIASPCSTSLLVATRRITSPVRTVMVGLFHPHWCASSSISLTVQSPMYCPPIW